MKAYIFENLSDLNEFLAYLDYKKVVDIKFQSEIIDEKAVDRFLVLTK